MKEKLKIPRGADGFAFHLVQPFRGINPHHHDELEVNVVTRGHASYLFGQRRVPLATHSMIWLFPQQEHVLIDYSRDFEMWVAVFRPELVRRESREPGRRILRKGDPGEIFCRQVRARQAEVLSEVFAGAVRGNSDVEFLNAALAYALVASWKAYEFSREIVTLSDVHPAVAKAARLLSEAEETISLEPLARQAGLSAARLSRLFKQQTGISVTGFRQRQCVERFRQLYRTGARYSLMEAALMAGFGSYPQFHRVFRQVMGMGPAEWRGRMKDEVRR